MADAVTVDEAYRESDDFVPNPSDMRGQYNTSGLGAHERIEEVSSVFEVDKVKTAQEIKDALDPDSPVSSSKVLLPDPVGDNEQALKTIQAAADARLAEGAVINGPGPAERDAALENKGDVDLRAEGTADERTSMAAKGTTQTAAQAAGDSDAKSDTSTGDKAVDAEKAGDPAAGSTPAAAKGTETPAATGTSKAATTAAKGDKK